MPGGMKRTPAPHGWSCDQNAITSSCVAEPRFWDCSKSESRFHPSYSRATLDSGSRLASAAAMPKLERMMSAIPFKTTFTSDGSSNSTIGMRMSSMSRNGFSNKRQSTRTAAKRSRTVFESTSVTGARKAAESRPMPFSPWRTRSVSPNVSIGSASPSSILDSVPMTSQRSLNVDKDMPAPSSTTRAISGPPSKMCNATSFA